MADEVWSDNELNAIMKPWELSLRLWN